MNKAALKFSLFLFVVMLSTSCVKYPQLLTFRDVEEFTPLASHEIDNFKSVTIQPDDILMIKVLSVNPVVAEPFNIIPSTNTSLSPDNATLLGYLVDRNGNIDFPVIGKLKVVGLTKDEIKALITKALEPYLKDPVILVRFMNYKITVMGEVPSPGVSQINSEKITILEAISMAGGFTAYSNKDRVLVIREIDGERTFGYLNLRSPEVFKSPYFYLLQNDVVYIEPIKESTAKVTDPVVEVLPIISGVVSLAALIIAILN